MPRRRTRCWQVTATWPGGATFTFGVHAKDHAAATVKAEGHAAAIRPGAAVTVTRLYWRGMRSPPVSGR